MDQSELPTAKKEILTRLLRSDGLRYSDAMPKDIPNDLFNYHLQHLVKLGFVRKAGERYTLTREGQRYVEVGQPITPSGDLAELFRVNILAILIKQENGRQYVLNQTRKRHPYYNDKGIIGGTVKPGELIENACMRVCARETGLRATFRLIGVIRKIRYTPDGSLFSDIFYHVGLGTEHDGELIPENEFGENYWAEYETALQNENSSVQGGHSIVSVLRALQDNKEIPFFYDQETMVINP